MKIWIRLGAVAALLALTGCETPPAAPPPPAPAPAPAASRPAPARPTPPASTGAATPATPGSSANTSANSPGAPGGPAGLPASKSAAGESALKEGVAAYENGDFGLAIRKLSAPEVYEGTTPDTQLQARKYLAFSYCVSGRRAQCRQQFDLVLRASPSFDLSAAEAGHPIWGPVFKQAKAAAGTRRP